MDAAGSAIKILFHYVKSSVKYDEWIDYGSPRICEYNSKVPFQEKKVRKKRATDGSENVLSQTADMPKPADVQSIRQEPSAAASCRERVTESPAVFEAQDLGSFSTYGVTQSASDTVVVEQPRSTLLTLPSVKSNGVCLTGTQTQPVQQLDRPFVEASRNQQLCRDFCADDWRSERWGNVRAHESQPTNGISSSVSVTRATSMTTFPDRTSRPPSFVTHRSDFVTNGIPGSSEGSCRPFGFDGISVDPESKYPAHFMTLSNGGKTVLSGLDMLAAVTTHGAFASLIESAPMTNTSAHVPLGIRSNSTGPHFQQAQPMVDAPPSIGSMQCFGLHQSTETPFYSEHTTSDR